MVILVTKKRKRKSNILFGLVIILCVLFILPLISFFYSNKTENSNIEEKPENEAFLYYEVSFVADCCEPVDSIFVKVGEQPILPTVKVICSHKTCDDEGHFLEGHSFVGWTYNGQFINQSNCPVFNTDVVLIAKIETVTVTALNTVFFPLEWLEYAK